MSRVECEVESITKMDERGNDRLAVRVTCTRCGHVEESWGQSDQSIRRSLAFMRENCPEEESNYYFVEDAPQKPSWWAKTPPIGGIVETPEVLKHLPLKPPGRR